MRVLFALLCLGTAAYAQQQPIQLTEWRAQLDTDLSRVSMPREAHAQVMIILQTYERQAQEKAAAAARKPKE